MRRNGRSVNIVEKPENKQRYKKIPFTVKNKARLGAHCKREEHGSCSKNRCTCFCHSAERKMMINP